MKATVKDAGSGMAGILNREGHKLEPKPRDWRDALRKNARTVGCIVRDTVELGGSKVTGEVEPEHDGAYERQTIRLRREGDAMVNANEFTFRTSMQWPGPLVKFHVHNSAGKVIAHAIIDPPRDVGAGVRIDAKEGNITFHAINKGDS